MARNHLRICKSLAVVGCVLAMAGLGACSQSTTGQSLNARQCGAPSACDERPCVVLFRPVRGKNGSDSIGIEVAVWPDGNAVYCFRGWHQKEQLFVGKVPPIEVEEAITLIRDSGFFETRAPSLEFCVPYSTIEVNAGGRSCQVNSVDVSFPENFDPHGVHYEFSRTWRRTRAAIDALTPTELLRFEDRHGASGEFRGYSLKHTRYFSRQREFDTPIDEQVSAAIGVPMPRDAASDF